MHLWNSEFWFATHVQTTFEWFVGMALRQKGYHVFVPFVGSQPTTKTAVVQYKKVLFPGYVFCRSHPDTHGLVVTTPRVIRILGTRTAPVPIDPSEIEAIQRVCETGLKSVPCKFVNVGDTVVVEDGPLKGIVGILTRFRNHTRVILSVTQCMRSISVDVDAYRLRRVAPEEVPVLRSSDRSSQGVARQDNHGDEKPRVFQLGGLSDDESVGVRH
jgi:transcription antitermination factor NusG